MIVKRRLRGGLLGLLLLPACGYNLAGRGAFLPDRIRTIGIPPFDSQVPRAQVGEKLTAAVTKEFSSRGHFKVIPGTSGADALLTGTVTGIVSTPTAFDSEGRATRSVLTVTAGVAFRDLQENKVLYENPRFEFRTEVDLSASTETYFDPESEALDQIGRDFARTLVGTLVEGF